jgi:hypothetical protein
MYFMTGLHLNCGHFFLIFVTYTLKINFIDRAVASPYNSHRGDNILEGKSSSPGLIIITSTMTDHNKGDDNGRIQADSPDPNYGTGCPETLGSPDDPDAAD